MGIIYWSGTVSLNCSVGLRNRLEMIWSYEQDSVFIEAGLNNTGFIFIFLLERIILNYNCQLTHYSELLFYPIFNFVFIVNILPVR